MLSKLALNPFNQNLWWNHNTILLGRNLQKRGLKLSLINILLPYLFYPVLFLKPFLFLVMIYVRKNDDQIFTPLHLVPPSLNGLAHAISDKFNVEPEKIKGFFKQCAKGVTVKIDDDMIKHYCNEDTYIIDIDQAGDDPSCCTVTLIELIIPQQNGASQPQYVVASSAHTPVS